MHIKLDSGLLIALRTLVWLLSCLTLSSCSVWNKVPEGQYLLVENRFKFEDSTLYEDIDKNDLIEEFNSLDSLERPNTKNLLQFYGKLNRYFRLRQKGKEEKIQSKLEIRKVERPSYYSPKGLKNSSETIELYLRNQGFFNASVSHEVKLNNKKAINTFLISLRRLMRVDSLNMAFPPNNEELKNSLETSKNESLLAPGSVLSKKNSLDEFDRIASFLRNNGYAYFTTQNFDPSPKVKKTQPGKYSVLLEILGDPTGETTRQYTFGDIRINRYYRRASDERTYFENIEEDSIIFLERPDLNSVRRRAFLDKIEFRPGQLYSEYLVRQTRQRLRQFRFYQNPIFNLEPNSSDSSKLDLTILLSSIKRYEIGANIDLNYILDVANTNLWGFSLSGRFVDYNFLGGGEVLTTSLSNEFQFNIERPEGSSTARNLVTFNPRIQLDVPRFYNYFGLYHLTKALKIGGYNFLELIEDFGTTTLALDYQYNEFAKQLRSSLFKASAGYQVTWPNQKNEVSINHFKFEYFFPQRLEEFDDSNPLRNRNFTQTLFTSLLLSDLYYGYNSDPQQSKPIRFSHSSLLDFSGIEIMAYEALTQGDTLRFFGDSEFARYIKFDQSHVLDINLPSETKLVTRLNYGIAIPLGNSSEIPFVKQFSLGGSNSMRAWNYRELGVGAYQDIEAEALADSSNFFYQSGDIKLELNLEYRFPILESPAFPFKVNGAIFTDLGNIWTLDQDDERPGSKFTSDFLSQLAIGAGAGLRFDLTFFILRFDLGYKLRQGYAGPDGRHAVGSDLFDAFSRGPRFVFGVGYPF